MLKSFIKFLSRLQQVILTMIYIMIGSYAVGTIISSRTSMLLAILVRFIALLIIVLMFRWLSTRTSIITDIKSCKKEFSDVIHITRPMLAVMNIICVITFSVFILSTFYSKEDIDVQYPDAEDIFVEDGTYTESELDLVRALPKYVNEPLYFMSQCCADIKDVKDAEDSVVEEYVNSTTTEFEHFSKEMNIRFIVSIISLFVTSLCYVKAQRLCTYFYYMKKFKEK